MRGKHEGANIRLSVDEFSRSDVERHSKRIFGALQSDIT